MSKKIGEITEELGSGLFPSQPGRTPVFWKDGRNVVFADGQLKAALGQLLLFIIGSGAYITGVTTSHVAGVPTIFVGTNTGLYKWDATGGLVDISISGGYSGTKLNLWSLSRWGDHLLATNGVDTPQYYQNSGDAVDLTGIPFTTAEIFETTDEHLIAMNTSLSGGWIGWTDADNVSQWTAAADNDAGSKYVRNLDSDIIAGKKLGGRIIAYTYNEMYAVDYIGRPFIFGILPLLEGLGPVGKNAVVAVGRKHFGFGRRGLWVTDGQSYQYIHSPALYDFVYKDTATRYNRDLGALVVGFHDQVQTQVVFYYPKNSGAEYNDIGIAYNYVNNTWTILDYGRTAATEAGVFSFALTGDRLGNIFQQATPDNVETSNDQDGIVLLDEEAGFLELGLGDAGLGESGLGGYEDASV